jgi:hypothetical protein
MSSNTPLVRAPPTTVPTGVATNGEASVGVVLRTGALTGVGAGTTSKIEFSTSVARPGNLVLMRLVGRARDAAAEPECDKLDVEPGLVNGRETLPLDGKRVVLLGAVADDAMPGDDMAGAEDDDEDRTAADSLTAAAAVVCVALPADAAAVGVEALVASPALAAAASCSRLLELLFLGIAGVEARVC